MAEPKRAAQNGDLDVQGARILIVEARFYDEIGTMLLNGAKAALKSANASSEVLTVPGALEIPATLAIALEAARGQGRPFDGAVALGCIIRGETYHFEVVCNESARALMDLSVALKLPLGNGILTMDTEEQAIVRADPSKGDKGGDAVRAALAVLRIKRQIGTH